VLHRYLLNFSLGLCGLICLVTFKNIFLLFKVKNLHSNQSCIIFGIEFYLLQYISIFLVLSELHSLNLKLCSKQYNNKFVLHLIVAPQLSNGWRHNYSTKTRPAGRANGQFSYVYGKMTPSMMALIMGLTTITWISFLAEHFYWYADFLYEHVLYAGSHFKLYWMSLRRVSL
jgi:hypothetical protein